MHKSVQNVVVFIPFELFATYKKNQSCPICALIFALFYMMSSLLKLGFVIPNDAEKKWYNGENYYFYRCLKMLVLLAYYGKWKLFRIIRIGANTTYKIVQQNILVPTSAFAGMCRDYGKKGNCIYLHIYTCTFIHALITV